MRSIKNFYFKLRKNLKKESEIYNFSIKKIKFQYDTIINGVILEHVMYDKKKILLALSKLKLNWGLIIIIPAFNFLYFNFDKSVGHYRRYSKNFLQLFLNKKLFWFYRFLATFVKKFLIKVNINSEKLPFLIHIWYRLFFLSKFFEFF